MTTAAGPGRVWAHVGQPFAETGYDVVVVGAGRMGTALALSLRRLAPGLRLLLLEETGLPNEEGATILAPGVWSAASVPPEYQAEARWVRGELAGWGGAAAFQPRPLARLKAPGGTATPDLLAAHPELVGLVDPALLPYADVEKDAATYRPGSLALSMAQAAIRAGADFMLNARAHAHTGNRVTVERLTVTNTHRVVTASAHEVRAAHVVLAMGAAGPRAAEHDLGLHTTHARAYRQSPRLNHASADTTPVLEVGGLLLRPQHGGYALCPPVHHRDPDGYVPAGGKLTGVPTGLRRETLEDLVAQMDALPALAGEGLEVGHSLSDTPGAWVALPGGTPAGLPTHQTLTPGLHLLLGGPHADTLGLSAAHDLAAEIAGVAGRPWDELAAE